jgi:signal peptide peptidase SppA
MAARVDQLMETPWPRITNNPPSGTRIGYDELVGVLDLEQTLPFRERLTQIADDDSVRAIALYINSPGGTVEGTSEAAEIVRRAAAEKPVHVASEGLLCSAAYHIACQATTMSAAPSTLVGSIGTVIALVDDSQLFAAMGVKVLPITTGINKPAGYPGVPVAEEHVAMFSRLVADMQQEFEIAILRGRKLNGKQLTDVTDGSVWLAKRALKLGLIDSIALPEDRFAEIERDNPAEQFTLLCGYDASAKFDELATAAAKCEFIEDVPAATLKRIRADYPTLAREAAEHDSKSCNSYSH